MYRLTEKLILNKRIALGIDDYNSHHKMARMGDFKESAGAILEELIFDLLLYKRDNTLSNDLLNLINVGKEILIIDDRNLFSEFIYFEESLKHTVVGKDNIPDDLSNYFLIIDIQFVKTTKSSLTLIDLPSETLFISLISLTNHKDEFKKEHFNEVLDVRFCTKNKSFKLQKNKYHKSVHLKEEMYMPFGPFPKPKKDWVTLTTLPIPQSVLDHIASFSKKDDEDL